MHRKLLLLFVLCLFMCAAGSAKDGIPHVVKRFNLYNQTGAIAPITLYTPKHSGMFRVNTVMLITVANKAQGFFASSVGFTDKLGAGTLFGESYWLYTETKGGASSGTIPVLDEGEQPLTLSVIADQEWQGAQYNVYVVVEEL
jgi:hypothetical protein